MFRFACLFHHLWKEVNRDMWMDHVVIKKRCDACGKEKVEVRRISQNKSGPWEYKKMGDYRKE